MDKSIGNQKTVKPAGSDDRSMGGAPTLPPRDGARPNNDHSMGNIPTMGGTGRLSGKRFQVGDVILGRYRVLSELGQGGMGVVYRCLDDVSGIEVALKALPPEVARNSGEMDEVRENFKLVSKLHHPNIANVNTLERDAVTGDFYLIMECVDGYDIRQWARKRMDEGRALTLDEVVIIAYRLAEAMDYAHEQGVIHRDIKPSNVRVNFAGEVKVLDFGLAAQIHTSMSRVSMAYKGTSGTGPYMAPEQWRGLRQGPAADQYALAATVYELLSGEPPFVNHDISILREVVLKEPAQPIEGVPKHVNSALLRGLAKEPGQRFASCGAFVEALGGKGVAVSSGSRQWRKAWLWLAGVAVIVVLSIASIWLYSTKRAETERAKAASAAIDVAQREKAEQSRLAAEKEEKRKQQEVDARFAEEKRKQEALASEQERLKSEAKKVTDNQKRLEDEKTALAEASRIERERNSKDEQEILDKEKQVTGTTPGERAAVSLGNGVSIELVWCPAGSFMMGSPSSEAHRKPEETQHRVTLTTGFWMGRTEVTQAQWEAIMGSNPSCFKGSDLPVETVSWEDCQTFVSKLNAKLADTQTQLRQGYVGQARVPSGGGFRLPTEAEWEYACRANSTGPYDGTLDEMGWYANNSEDTIHPVGRKRANAWGLYDMHGNVWEWCQDWSGDYPAGSVTDPYGMASGERRIYRGGGWDNIAKYCRSAIRRRIGQGNRFNSLGLRLVRTPVLKENKGERKEVKILGPVEVQDWTSHETGMEFVWIEALKLWVGKYEVTNGEYRKKEKAHDSKDYQRISLNGERQPVVYVNFDDAMEYAAWLTEKDKSKLGGLRYRVPSEAEWLTFAQCGDNREYPWGNAMPPKYGNYQDLSGKLVLSAWKVIDRYKDGHVVSSPVEQSGKNDWGLYGVGGNVWEACAADASAATFGGWRGACWDEGIQGNLLCASRALFGGSHRSLTRGFRLVVSRTAEGQIERDAGNQSDSRVTSSMLEAVPVKTAGGLTGEEKQAGSTVMGKGPTEGQPWVSLSTGMEFVWIEALKLWVGTYEVTNGEYRKKVPGHNIKDFRGQSLNGQRQPVVYVNFDDAKEYAAWLTDNEKTRLGGKRYRVISEKEWQTAAQCGDGRTYPWGNSMPPKYGNYADSASKIVLKINGIVGYKDESVVTCSVERSGKNDWGLFGLGGNVWDICAADATGASFGAWRGAAWGLSDPDFLRCDTRKGSSGGEFRSEAVGFRLVVSR
ncbi:MAG: SUMF1/EgtB/PvdO family nonheme iron enzyme [bacterium]